MFAAPLWINKDAELTIANEYVNHNYQNLSAITALKITNTIYNNPLHLEIRHDATVGDTMKTLLTYYKKVREQWLYFYAYSSNLMLQNSIRGVYLTFNLFSMFAFLR